MFEPTRIYLHVCIIMFMKCLIVNIPLIARIDSPIQAL